MSCEPDSPCASAREFLKLSSRPCRRSLGSLAGSAVRRARRGPSAVATPRRQRSDPPYASRAFSARRIGAGMICSRQRRGSRISAAAPAHSSSNRAVCGNLAARAQNRARARRARARLKLFGSRGSARGSRHGVWAARFATRVCGAVSVRRTLSDASALGDAVHRVSRFTPARDSRAPVAALE